MSLQRRPRVLRVAERPAFEAGERRGRDFTADKVVFLAHWADQPRVTRSVSTLVEQFVDHGYAVLMSSSAVCRSPLEWPQGLPPGVTVYRRPNLGYDFGSWAAVMDLHPAALAAEHALVVNDSLVGPFAPLTAILTGFEECGTDVWGLIDTHQDEPHLQSHWIGYHGGRLAEPPLREFWSDIRIEPTKRAIIQRYEMGQTRNFAALGYSVSVQFPFSLVVQPGQNPTSIGWRRLLSFGFPFVKREIAMRPPPEVPDGFAVPEVIAERFDTDVREWL